MRSARILICFSLSSPETYNIFFDLELSANCNKRVDFPIPGSPPNSIKDPGTIPPPSTLFNSLSLVTILFSEL